MPPEGRGATRESARVVSEQAEPATRPPTVVLVVSAVRVSPTRSPPTQSSTAAAEVEAPIRVRRHRVAPAAGEPEGSDCLLRKPTAPPVSMAAVVVAVAPIRPAMVQPAMEAAGS